MRCPPGLSVTTNEVCVAWTAKVGSTYYVQGTIEIESSNWTTLSTTNATQANMSFCLPLSTPFHFFRVSEAGATNQPPSGNTNQVQLSPPMLLPDGALQLQWAAVVGQKYKVQFTTNLVPAVWTTLTNITATTDPMVFKQSGPLTNSVVRFYRVIKP